MIKEKLHKFITNENFYEKINHIDLRNSLQRKSVEIIINEENFNNKGIIKINIEIHFYLEDNLITRKNIFSHIQGIHFIDNDNYDEDSFYSLLLNDIMENINSEYNSTNINYLAEEMENIISNYRVGKISKIDKAHILKWVNQFNEHERYLILYCTLGILKKRYIDKETAITYFNEELKKLGDVKILKLQKNGKSQSDIITELNPITNKESKIYVYIDDVLCTGGTFYNDIVKNVKNNEYDKIIYLSLCSHEKNKNKKITNFKNSGYDKIEFISKININNYNNSEDDSFIMPKQGLFNEEYEEIKNIITEGNKNKTFELKEDFYRIAEVKNNIFENGFLRDEYTKIIFIKSMELFNLTDKDTSSKRPLGCSYPSFLDFGFGGLFFTWRNIPNNTPMAFWSTAGGFYPLFPRI